MKVIPEHLLRLISPADRKSMGKAGLTRDEILVQQETRSESQLQNQIIGHLKIKGIEVIASRMNKRTTNNVGTPDILFSFCGEQAGHTRVFACSFEVKMPGKDLEPEQAKMAVRMTSPPNAWSHRTVRSLDEVIAFLRERGIT